MWVKRGWSGWKMLRTYTTCNTTPVWSIVVATAATCSRPPCRSRPGPAQNNPHKNTFTRENTHLCVWNESVRGGLSAGRTTFCLPPSRRIRGCHSLGCKYGCWAAARGESAWITGGWTGPVLLAASLGVQDHSYTGYQAADTVDTDRCFSSRTLARARPDGFPRRTAASAAVKSNFSVCGSDWAGSVRTRQLFCRASPRWCRCPQCGVGLLG